MVREILEGKVFSGKRYGDFEVLEYLGDEYYKIKFIKTNTISKFKKEAIIKGTVRDKFYPTVYNTGCLGDKYNSNHFLNSRWTHMIGRCYNKNHSHYINYGAKGITVCERWLCFSNYVDDVILLEGYNEELVKTGKLQLDKDVIDRNAKIYSPETCKWVTGSENVKEMLKGVRQKDFIAIRLSDNYKEYSHSIVEFCKKWKLDNRKRVEGCLKGRINSYSGWKFEYKNNPMLIFKKYL